MHLLSSSVSTAPRRGQAHGRRGLRTSAALSWILRLPQVAALWALAGIVLLFSLVFGLVIAEWGEETEEGLYKRGPGQ